MLRRRSEHKAAGQGQQTDDHRFTDRYVSLDAAVAAIIERYCDTSRGILCSDFRYAADFLLEEFGSSSDALKGEQG